MVSGSRRRTPPRAKETGGKRRQLPPHALLSADGNQRTLFKSAQAEKTLSTFQLAPSLDFFDSFRLDIYLDVLFFLSPTLSNRSVSYYFYPLVPLGSMTCFVFYLDFMSRIEIVLVDFK